MQNVEQLDGFFEQCLRRALGENIQITMGHDAVIELKGKSWDGLVDFRVMAIIDKLQDSVLQIYNANTGDNVTRARLKEEAYQFLAIRVRVCEGSAVLEISKEIIGKMVERMDGKHVVATVAILATMYGTVSVFNRHYDSADNRVVVEGFVKTNQLMAERHAETQRLFAEFYNDTKLYNATKAPLDAIAQNMDENDTVKFTSSRMFDREEVKKIAKKRREHIPANTVFADGEYVINQVSHFEGAGYVLSLSVDGEIRYNHAMLKYSVFEQFDLFDALERLYPVPLQLDVTLKKDKPTDVVVVGTGDPRNQ